MSDVRHLTGATELAASTGATQRRRRPSRGVARPPADYPPLLVVAVRADTAACRSVQDYAGPLTPYALTTKPATSMIGLASQRVFLMIDDSLRV